EKKIVTTATCLLLPTAEQKAMLEKWFGNCVELWNMVLADKLAFIEQNKCKPWMSAKELNQMPRITTYTNRPGYEHLKDTEFTVYMNLIYTLCERFEKYVATHKEEDIPKTKNPHGVRCVSITNDLDGYSKVKRIGENRLWICKIGEIDAKIYMPFPDLASIKKIRIKRSDTGKYFLDLLYETMPRRGAGTLDESKAVGLDYSPYRLFIDSEGYSPDFTGKNHKLDKRRRETQRVIARKEKGSGNLKEELLEIRKIEERIVNERRNVLNKEVHRLIENYDYIFLETLSMEEMAIGKRDGSKETPGKGRRCAVYAAAFDEFRRLLVHQAKKAGKVVYFIPSNAKTTYVCNVCGKEYDQKSLKIRSWTCPQCGTFLDRDVNAAVNIKNIGMRCYKRETQTN
ncbi:MAG: transposase, partial [Clostridia bacterium]|nr:transposase [Clostridia bacterium]